MFIFRDKIISRNSWDTRRDKITTAYLIAVYKKVTEGLCLDEQGTTSPGFHIIWGKEAVTKEATFIQPADYLLSEVGHLIPLPNI